MIGMALSCGIGLDAPRRLVAVHAPAAGCPSGSDPGGASRRLPSACSPSLGLDHLVAGACQAGRAGSAGCPPGPRPQECALLMPASACRSTLTGSVKEKVEPWPRLGFDPDPAAMHLDDALGDRQPEPGAALLLRGRAVGLLELLEDLALIGGGDARPGVAHRRPERAVRCARP